MNFEEFWKGVKVAPEIEKIRLKGVCNSVWNAAIDEAVKIAEGNQLDPKSFSTIPEKIKELKE